MKSLRYTLLADGSSDKCLIRIIDSVLNEVAGVSAYGLLSQVADLRLRSERAPTLADRMREARDQFPCDVLFVHRDAEREPMQNRLSEIATAAAQFGDLACVPIVPVRMTEAWLLLETQAIRSAADNPNGSVSIELPRASDLENVPDPKGVLDGLLIAASEKTGRRLAQFKRDLPRRRGRVAALIHDFSPLRQLPAFNAFRAEAERVLHHWMRFNGHGARGRDEHIH